MVSVGTEHWQKLLAISKMDSSNSETDMQFDMDLTYEDLDLQDHLASKLKDVLLITSKTIENDSVVRVFLHMYN